MKNSTVLHCPWNSKPNPTKNTNEQWNKMVLTKYQQADKTCMNAIHRDITAEINTDSHLHRNTPSMNE
jgi:hypothetical protein